MPRRLLLWTRDVDTGEKSDESSTNVDSCKNCGQTFNSRQELKEHSSIHP